MSEVLSSQELIQLITRVFQPRPDDRAVAILVDLPDDAVPDEPTWLARREMAAGWWEALSLGADELSLPVDLFLYRNVRMANADLPAELYLHAGGVLPATAEDLPATRAQPLEAVLRHHTLVIAPTQFSATAPLKLLAPRLGFRAATMPGFSEAMIPALRLDYQAINRRVALLADRLTQATAAHLHFRVRGGLEGDLEHHLQLDLRHRTAHASGGLLPEPGTAGNLPSGESYIVPYEGEVPGEPSTSRGTLPVQFGDEVVIYRIEENRAREVLTDGPMARDEAEHLRAEPAYGNLAELGLGVLADFGVLPTGELLLDEKLGLHIAFGRSDHFGGQVGARQFSRKEAVVHIDRVYLPSVQPRVTVVSVDLDLGEAGTLPLIRDDRYVIVFD